MTELFQQMQEFADQQTQQTRKRYSAGLLVLRPALHEHGYNVLQCVN